MPGACVVLLLLLSFVLAEDPGCPPGWTASKSVQQKCYLSSTSDANERFAAAAQWCLNQDSRSTLVVIESEHENAEISGEEWKLTLNGFIELLDSLQPDEGNPDWTSWTGLQYNDTSSAWEWVDGEPLNYTNWRPDTSTFGYYGVITPTGWLAWAPYFIGLNTTCQLYYSLVPSPCPPGWTPSKTVDRKCYRITSEYAGYYENVTAWCSNRDPRATPLTIRNGFENAEINDLATMMNAPFLWLGLRWNTDNTQWEWCNGEQLNYTNWIAGEPTFTFSVTTDVSFGGLWGTGYETMRFSMGCQLYY